MTVSTESCAALLHRLPVLAAVKRHIRRSGTTLSTSVLTVLAALDGAPAPAAPSSDHGWSADNPSTPGRVDDAAGPDSSVRPCQRLGVLADKLQVDLSVASRQVAHLIEMGAVERVLDATDRRVHLLRVTPSGHRDIALARERAAEHLAGRLTSWTEQDLQTLVVLLGRLQDDLRPDPRDDPGPVPPPASTVPPRTTPSPSTEYRP